MIICDSAHLCRCIFALFVQKTAATGNFPAALVVARSHKQKGKKKNNNHSLTARIEFLDRKKEEEEATFSSIRPIISHPTYFFILPLSLADANARGCLI